MLAFTSICRALSYKINIFTRFLINHHVNVYLGRKIERELEVAFAVEYCGVGGCSLAFTTRKYCVRANWDILRNNYLYNIDADLFKLIHEFLIRAIPRSGVLRRKWHYIDICEVY